MLPAITSPLVSVVIVIFVITAITLSPRSVVSFLNRRCEGKGTSSLCSCVLRLLPRFALLARGGVSPGSLVEVAWYCVLLTVLVIACLLAVFASSVALLLMPPLLLLLHLAAFALTVAVHVVG